MLLLRRLMIVLALLALGGEALHVSLPHADHHHAHADCHAGGEAAEDKADHDSHALHACGVCHHLMMGAASAAPPVPACAPDRFAASETPPHSRGAAPPHQPPIA